MIVIYLSMAKKSPNLKPSSKCINSSIFREYSADFNQADIKSTGLYGYAYDFSVEYWATAKDKILEIYNYLNITLYNIKCLGLLKNDFFTAIAFFSSNVLNVNYLECVSMSDQECKARPKVIDVNANEPVFYPYPDIVKNINVKVFNLMSRINEIRQIIWRESCKCVCRLTPAICNSRQVWNEDRCRCECGELANKGTCDKGYIWNRINCA